MGKLKENLAKKIPDWRYNYRQLLDEKGDHVTSTVTIILRLQLCRVWDIGLLV